MKMNYDLVVRVCVFMVNKDERNYVIIFDKEKSICILVCFFIFLICLKFNYY